MSNYDLPVTKEDCVAKLREEFKRHANVKDVRVIDILLIKVSLICILFISYILQQIY